MERTNRQDAESAKFLFLATSASWRFTPSHRRSRAPIWFQLRFELARRFGLSVVSEPLGLAALSPTRRDDSGTGMGRCDEGGAATTTPGRVGGSNTGGRCDSGTR